MRVGFVVNEVATELVTYTTTRLGRALVNRGHEVWSIGVGEFALDPDDSVCAVAVQPPKSRYTTDSAYHADLTGPRAAVERIIVDDLDVLMLRNDPSIEKGGRHWARTAALDFGRMATRRGVIVLNDPNGLAMAANKMYFQEFPEEVRPATLISRHHREIRDFVEKCGRCVIKPLHGSGGDNVFLVRADYPANVNQIIDVVTSEGYVVVQEYLPRAEQGDIRLFLMNGEPLRFRGRYAAFRRIGDLGDLRSNIHAGGLVERATIDDDALRLAEIVRPKLVADGMFLAGLDIVGDKLMEINVFSPGGLGHAHRQERVRFEDAVVDALERKVDYAGFYRRHFDNVEMATL